MLTKSTITQNNWLLPIKDEYFMCASLEDAHRIQLREQGQQVLIDMETPLTFNQMHNYWWTQYFASKPYTELLKTAKNLGVLPSKRTKGNLVIALTTHYQLRFL